MGIQSDFLRYLSPNEQRTVCREGTGFYYAVIVGATYNFDDNVDTHATKFFFHPLQKCIEEHPYLSVTVGDGHTDKSFFQRVPSIDLLDHISIAEYNPASEDLSSIEELITSNLDRPFPSGIPPWRIVVLSRQGECFVAFCFSHTIGDGPTGTAFHHTFLRACKNISSHAKDASRVIATPVRPLPAPFDTPERLPISWGFLLAPLIALFLPSFITRFLGLRDSAALVDSGTWTGSRISFDPKTSHSKMRLREVDAAVLENALHLARKHDAKLTAVFQQIVARALNKAIPDQSFNKIISAVAINMRKSIGLSNEEGGEYASACFMAHPRGDTSKWLSEESWATASSITRRLAEASTTLKDQPIGLLRYLPSVRKWTISKLGERRDCSFEVSNVGAFHDRDFVSNGVVQAKITQMIFAQPGHVAGPAICFNLVSVTGRTMVFTVTWRAGALGIVEEDEDSFVDALCASIVQDLQDLK